jgi:MOSC domain-containing protein YiiM
VDECQVTLIEVECLDEIRAKTGVTIEGGEHRRNIVTRGIELESLLGKRFQVGTAIFEYDRPRPPCGYIEKLTEPGMTRALVGRGGICARVVGSGTIRASDPIVVL